MKRLTDEQIEAYRKQIDGKHGALYAIKARVEYPLGEIERLSGFWWAKSMRGEKPNVQPIVASDRFNAQGLEGKVVEDCNIVDAIMRWNFCLPNRCQIFVE